MSFGSGSLRARVIINPSLCASQDEGPSGLEVTRVFNPSDFPRIHHCHCGDQHGLLHSCGYHDLLSIAAHGPEIAQVRCDCFAKIGITQV
jgi:hypothetical protein